MARVPVPCSGSSLPVASYRSNATFWELPAASMAFFGGFLHGLPQGWLCRRLARRLPGGGVAIRPPSRGYFERRRPRICRRQRRSPAQHPGKVARGATSGRPVAGASRPADARAGEVGIGYQDGHLMSSPLSRRKGSGLCLFFRFPPRHRRVPGHHAQYFADMDSTGIVCRPGNWGFIGIQEYQVHWWYRLTRPVGNVHLG